VNPEGILSQSPGLRGTRYPGKTVAHDNNPEGVVALALAESRNPFRVEDDHRIKPRVARGLATLGWRTQSLRD